MAGVEHSVKFFKELADVVIELIALVKSGIGFGSIGKLVALAKDLGELVLEAKAALPELADVDREEMFVLGQAAYDCLRSIIKSV